MKRNYVALLLGLALTVSSMGVYASEGTTEAATETTTEATTEAATAEASKDENADTEAIVGQVTKVSADSITITKGVLAADDEETEADTESTTDAEATTEAASEDTTEAAAEDNPEAVTEAASSQTSLTLTLTNESLTYNFADDAKLGELAQTENIEVKAADSSSDTSATEATTEKASEAVSEAATEAASEEDTTEAASEDATETGTEVATEAASEDVTEESVEVSEDGTISITADGIMEGDIVSIQLNSDGTVASLTILAYGTGTVVGEADEDTEISLYEDSTEAADASVDTEAATEAVTE